MPLIWSIAMIEDLKRMRDENMSLLQIATYLGATYGVEVTRNMVSGKVNRLGLEKKPMGRFAKRAPPPPPPAMPLGESRTILSIGPRQCRWPLDLFDESGCMLFCGKRKAHGSFCEHHAERVWIKSRRI
jgi:hypothetical protein